MGWIAIAAAITVIIAPALLALEGWRRTRHARVPGASAIPWRLCFASALAFTLAFNLQFFVQELFLVVPKALTPGLRPTLFHNNHGWTGDSPLAELFQGTGALATLITGAISALSIARARGSAARLLLIWLSYCGVIMALAQVVVGALSPQSDLGRAMNYLQLPGPARYIAAALALALMPAFALWLMRRLLNLTATSSGTVRARQTFFIATLPALLALVLIIPFRVPREFIEVIVVPAAVVLAGVPWIQAGAFRMAPDSAPSPQPLRSFTWLLVANIVLLTIFQIVLRPGVKL